AVEHLTDELEFLAQVERDWRFDEVVANVYLLACALFNAAEEHLRGPSLRLSSRIADTPPGAVLCGGSFAQALHRPTGRNQAMAGPLAGRARRLPGSAHRRRRARSRC